MDNTTPRLHDHTGYALMLEGHLADRARRAGPVAIWIIHSSDGEIYRGTYDECHAYWAANNGPADWTLHRIGPRVQS